MQAHEAWHDAGLRGMAAPPPSRRMSLRNTCSVAMAVTTSSAHCDLVNSHRVTVSVTVAVDVTVDVTVALSVGALLHAAVRAPSTLYANARLQSL